MSLFLLYLIIALAGGIAAITSVSNGWINNYAGLFIFATIAILIAASIYIALTFNIFNILGLIGAYIVSAWIFSYLWITIFNKGRY